MMFRDKRGFLIRERFTYRTYWDGYDRVLEVRDNATKDERSWPDYVPVKHVRKWEREQRKKTRKRASKAKDAA